MCRYFSGAKGPFCRYAAEYGGRRDGLKTFISTQKNSDKSRNPINPCTIVTTQFQQNISASNVASFLNIQGVSPGFSFSGEARGGGLRIFYKGRLDCRRLCVLHGNQCNGVDCQKNQLSGPESILRDILNFNQESADGRQGDQQDRPGLS